MWLHIQTVSHAKTPFGKQASSFFPHVFFPTIEGAKITNRIPWWDLIPGDVDCVSNWSNSPLGFSRVKRTPRERGHIFWHVYIPQLAALGFSVDVSVSLGKRKGSRKWEWFFNGYLMVFSSSPLSLSMGEDCQFWLIFFSEAGSKHHPENDAKLCRYNELTRKCIHDMFDATWKSTWMLTCICYLNM